MAQYHTENLAAAFATAAMTHPDRQAIVAQDLTLTYGKLWLIVQSFALRMQAIGIDQNAVVALKSTDVIASVAVMFATTLLGAGFVVWEDRLLEDHVVIPTHVLRSPDVSPPENAPSILMDERWSPKNIPLPDQPERYFLGLAADPTAPWWYLHTSGTTGRPKYLALSQRMAIDRSRAVTADFQGAKTRFCALFPCYTRPFFVRAMAALVNGSTIIDTIDADFMQAQGVTLVCGSPRQAEQWLTGKRLAHRLPVLQISGARFAPKLATDLLGAFEQVQDVYGSSETNKAFVNCMTLAGGAIVTRPAVQDSNIEIRRADASLCCHGEIGELRIRNSYTVSGYIAAPEATAMAFRDGWFHPGDLARWDRDGALEIVGRVDEIINLGGLKIDPLSVETALRGAGIRQAACFRDPHGALRLLACVEIDTICDTDWILRQAMERCVATLGPLVTPALIYVVDKIPMTHDGVPLRGQCAVLAKDLHRFEEGNHDRITP